MLDILAITTPIYLIVALGFVLVRAGLFPKVELKVLGKYVVQVSLPALVFNALAQRRFDEVFDARYLAVYAAGSLVAMAAGWLWARRVGGQSPVAAAISAMGTCCANSGFIGYPILLLALPAVAGVTLALNLLVENLLMLPLVLALAEQGRSAGGGWTVFLRAMAKTARNPLVVAMGAGVAVSVAGVALPAPLAVTMKMLAGASGALSLFVIGGALVGLSASGLGARVVAAAAALVATVGAFATLNVVMWALGVMPG